MPTHLLSGVQLLQDDAYVRAVLMVGAGFGGAGAGRSLSGSQRLIQDGEEGQTVAIFSSLLFLLVSLCSDFTQDLGLCFKGNTAQ